MAEGKWVPENLDQLEKYASALEGTTAASLSQWNAFDLSLLGFSLKRLIAEARTARKAGFDPANTSIDPNTP